MASLFNYWLIDVNVLNIQISQSIAQQIWSEMVYFIPPTTGQLPQFIICPIAIA